MSKKQICLAAFIIGTIIGAAIAQDSSWASRKIGKTRKAKGATTK